MANVIGTLFRSPRAQRRFFWLSAGVLVVGVAVFASLVIFRGTGNAFPDKFSNQKAQLAKPDPSAPLQKSELALARRFLETAVLRKNLNSAYSLVDVDLRGRMTRTEWDTGNIPVIEYNARNAGTAHFQVDYSRQRSALLEVELVAAQNSSEQRKSLLFFLGLKRKGDKASGNWVVSYWEPHWHPPVPAAPD